MVCGSRLRPMPHAKHSEHTTTPGHAPRVSHRFIVSATRLPVRAQGRPLRPHRPARAASPARKDPIRAV
eukprot:1339360-Prymnesium_polylepis.1